MNLKDFNENVYRLADKVHFNSRIGFSNVDVFGMDMDDTIIMYKPENEHLRYRLVARNLAENNKDYKFLLDKEYEPNAFIRGLVIDSLYGTVLKINSRKQVDLAKRGFESLTANQKNEYYKNPLTLEEEINNAKRFHFIDSRYYCVDAFLYSEIINYHNKHIQINQGAANMKVFQDIRDATEKTYETNEFLANVSDDFSKYIITSLPSFDYSERVKSTLRHLRNNNKKVFLITNSPERYTDSVLRYFLGDSYYEYFDEIVVRAKKPGFFSGDKEFLKGRHGQIKIGGSYSQLLKSYNLSRDTDVIYVGDHIKGDIISGQRKQGVIPAAIVPELMYDLRNRSLIESLYNEINNNEVKIEALRGVLSTVDDSDIGLKLKQEIDILKEAIIENKDKRFELVNPNWGSPFKTGTEELSFWAYQIDNFAGMYMALISSIRNLDLHKKLGPDKKRVMAHEL